MSEHGTQEKLAALDALLSKLDKLIDSMSVKNAPPLWNAAQIGEWLGLSAYTIKHAVVCQPGFPAPVKATGMKECQRRWFADEVIDWARKNRGTLPVGRPNARPPGRPRNSTKRSSE